MQIKIEEGSLKGSEGIDYDGNKYYSFQGIPYAKPPVGNLRFKAPQPVEPWNEILDATQERSICYSKNFVTKEIEGSEDCLYLNVYSKNIPSKKLQPVMVWIHGGGYVCGSGNTDLYGPDHLLTQNIIVVTFNYRLGIWGFLGFEDTSLEIPGNAGLKDMVMALKWVKRNIVNFGGDPNNVTIFGHSAGSASVNFLLLSPTSKGLFHRAILLSGSSVCYWATGKKCGKDVAAALGFKSSDEKEILKFLQKQSSEKLMEAQTILREELNPSKTRLFCPTIENPNPTAFITESPLNLLKSGNFHKVPLMIGYTSQESIFFELFQEFMKCSKFTNFEEAISTIWGKNLNQQEKNEIASKIKKFYFGDKDPASPECEINHLNLGSDTAIVVDSMVVAKLLKANSQEPIFIYRFSAETKLNLFKKLAESTVPGASHGDELPYIFKTGLNPKVSTGSIEDQCIRRIVKLFTNFAKTSNPTPADAKDLIKWEPMRSKDSLNCLDIGNELRNYDVIPEIDRVKFWEEILKIKL